MTDSEDFFNRGIALWQAGKREEALASTEAALAARPDYAQAHYNRGTMLQSLERHGEALLSFDAALAVNPGLFQAHNARGNALRSLSRDEEALNAFNLALRLKPDFVAALNNRAGVLLRQHRYAESLATLDALLRIQPRHVNGLLNRTIALHGLDRDDEVIAFCKHVLAMEPDNADAFARLFSTVYNSCDWKKLAALIPQIRARTEAGEALIQPFELLGVFDDPALHRRGSENQKRTLQGETPLWTGAKYDHDRIRVAYLSADFNSHATALLAAQLFERHDRTRFEIIGICFSFDDASAMRTRLMAAFDQFIVVKQNTDAEVAKLLRDMEIDIAVDLKGHTTDSRPAILSYRPAPVQVHYLGYPGTSAVDFIDYIIADAVVLPFDQQSFYSEKIVHLPGSYQVNDSARPLLPAPTRESVGLPAGQFVFASFNNHWKITEEMFALWMRLLAAIPGSVLWLLQGKSLARRNLAAAAREHGIDPARLIFCERISPEAHLARHRLVDLSLDTLPVNAHTSASDSLWAGVPVVTCMGQAFAGRVAASLLRAVGLPELVTQSLEDYEALALALARDPARLAELRGRLAANRLTEPLFDTARFTRNLERAYEIMHARAGQAPAAFAVPED